MEPSHVLVPLDGSPLSDEALTYALDAFDCKVTVLNVVTPLDSNLSEGGMLEVDEERESAAQDHAEQVIKHAKRQAEEVDRTLESAVETGDPADTIIEYAEMQDVDQIIMGAHSEDRGRLARRLLGTVSTAVVGDSPVTVTVVK